MPKISYSLRQQSTDLPQTDTDRAVVNIFFGAVSAVQAPCSADLKTSLKAERASAACASYENTFYAELGDTLRQLVDSQFLEATYSSTAQWLSPWQSNDDFGTIRQLEYEGTVYYLALNNDEGSAHVIKFSE